MFFRDEYDFLSNFYPSPIQYEGRIYLTAENIYQASKSLDPAVWDSFQYLSPKEAKKRGRRLVLRPDWHLVKLSAMVEFVNLKFNQNPELMKKLLATGDIELIEDNTWGDRFWGRCDGQGNNHLGKILMEIRFLNNVYGKVESF